jgi:hypothetical protein
MRATLLFVLALIAGTSTHAAIPEITEIIRLHVAAIGGRERLDALNAFRATGYVISDGQRVPIKMIAARPNRLRMEYAFSDGRLVQATDGVAAPWELDERRTHAKRRLMDRAEAESLTDEADFDDPLVAARKRGDVIEYAGDSLQHGRPVIRLLVTRQLARSYFLNLDADTYWIVSRVDPKPAAGGVEVITEYSDFRPIGGVLAAHVVKIWENGRLTQEARLEHSEANPLIDPAIFSLP